MKIGVLIDQLTLGGAEKVAIQQVKALRLIGEDAYLLVLRRGKLRKQPFADLLADTPILFLDDRLFDVFKISFKIPFFHFFSLFHITYPFFIPWVIKNKEFDYIVSSLTYTSFSAIGIRVIEKIPFSAFIWDPIGCILERVYSKKFSKTCLSVFIYIAKILDKFIVNYSDIIFVGGSAHNGYLRSLTKTVNIKVLPPSISPLSEISKDKQDYALLATSWKKGKNPEYIFELIKRLPNIKFKIAGGWLDDKYKERFEDEIKQNKLTEKIKVLGGVTEKELANLYENALFFLQINDDRGFGLPAMEAAAHGTTFIIPGGQGVCELFQDKIDGFFVKEKDTEEISRYIKKIIDDKQLALKMGRHAWETIKENFTWKRHAEKLLSEILRYKNS